MAEKDAPATKKAASKKSVAKKATIKKAPAKKAVVNKKIQEHITVEDMHKLLTVLQDGLASRDKVVEHLQLQIEQNQLQAA